MNESDALLILNAIPQLRNADIHRLVQYYGSAQKVLAIGSQALIADQAVSPGSAAAIAQFPHEAFLKNEETLIRQGSIKILTINDADYPLPLRAIADAPVVLYVRGQVPENMSLAIGIVGSRQASFYGITIAQQFAARLAEAGLTIVSGMARGIDAAAHHGALHAKRTGANTVAILGCGLSQIYPLENAKLYEEVANKGALISEFPMKTPPLAYNFPRRNRIISGLSLGVIVVEAAARSGALITADCALEQGREVYAVPGKVDSPTSKGVHNLIKQGAKLVSCVDDILEDLRPLLLAGLNSLEESPNTVAIAQISTKILSETELLVYNAISDRPVHIDELADRCDTDPLDTNAVLLRLELKHFIKQLPGKLFVRQ